MLYALLCYHQEDVVCAWSKEEDDAVMKKLLAVQEPWVRAGKLGPIARLLPTTAATTLRKDSDPPEQPSTERSVYSFDAIDHLLEQLRRQEDAWRGFFFRIGQRPLQLYYEDIANDLEASVGRVLDAVLVERPPAPLLGAGALTRQSDELSESWVQNYLEDVSRR